MVTTLRPAGFTDPVKLHEHESRDRAADGGQKNKRDPVVLSHRTRTGFTKRQKHANREILKLLCCRRTLSPSSHVILTDADRRVASGSAEAERLIVELVVN